MTRIIATLGPATADPAMIARLIEEGARVFRINFSHGDAQDHLNLLEAVKEARELTQVNAAILGDLSGPKLRMGKYPSEGIVVEPGDRVEFVREPFEAAVVEVSPEGQRRVVCSTTYAPMVDEVQPGHRVLVDDGNVRMLAVDRIGNGEAIRLVCHVTEGGLITTSKGVNLPDSALSLPSMTEKDWRCVDWAVEHDVDYLALSFVRHGSDVATLKAELKRRAKHGTVQIPVIAKIETPQALKDLDHVVDESDAVMVARGDLGVEMDVTEVPAIQKRIIRLCNDYGKPVIVATQMLQSMIDSPVPTRAEVSDIANALEDGAGAVMLSGETAVGKFPAQAVRFMAKTAENTLAALPYEWWNRQRAPKKLVESRYRTAAMAHGVKTIVQDLGAKAVVTWSQGGGGARYLSQNRVGVTIYAASSNPLAIRRMQLLFGVVPTLTERCATCEEFLELIDARGRERGWFKAGDPIVAVVGEPLGSIGVTNQIRIHYSGDVCNVR